jgi:hypothetical protein
MPAKAHKRKTRLMALCRHAQALPSLLPPVSLNSGKVLRAWGLQLYTGQPHREKISCDSTQLHALAVNLQEPIRPTARAGSAHCFLLLLDENKPTWANGHEKQNISSTFMGLSVNCYWSLKNANYHPLKVSNWFRRSLCSHSVSAAVTISFPSKIRERKTVFVTIFASDYSLNLGQAHSPALQTPTLH